MSNRIRDLRTSHDLSQRALGLILGTTQQAISRMEKSDYDIQSDLLIKMANHFNVTSDYILGISDFKRDSNCQTRMNCEICQHYDIVLRYQKLSANNQKIIQVLIKCLEEAERESLHN